MRASGPIPAPVSRWRSWVGDITGLWRRSLRFRIVTITLALSSLAIFITSFTLVLVVQNDLFESRKEQVLDDALRAAAAAQDTLNSADVTDDPAALRKLWNQLRYDVSSASSSNLVAAFPEEGGRVGSGILPFTQGLSSDLLSDGLRERVRELPDSQFWQSVTLPATEGSPVPGIVVGQQLIMPEVGEVELYIAYDLADADQTLQFVQRAMWLAGLALIALIGGISWIVLRSVSAPISEASTTSARLAAGDLEVRLPVHGEDELATLATSFNAMADSIQSQIKELGELSLVQQRFVSDVSHELRTPLTTIRLAADMLNDQRSQFDSTTARTAELLHTQVQRFETLLADLLEISRYDAGSVQLEREPTSLAQTAEDVIEQMRPLAEGRGSALRLVAPGGYSPVEIDPRRVRRILRNLIGNAIEHGEGQPIVVSVDSNQHAVAVGVRDYGMGMSPEDAVRVFDRFWRADPSRQRTIGGTGLGLSIALGDATLHGGTLQVWSELGVGTHFVLALPRQDGESAEPSPIPVEPQETLSDLAGVTEPIEIEGLSAVRDEDERGEERR